MSSIGFIRKFYIILLLLTFFAGYTNAQESESLEITHGPWLQNVTESSASIFFTTNNLVVPGVMIRSGNENFKLVQNSTDGLVNVGDNLHKIKINNLLPGEKYEYKLVAREIESYRPYKVEFGETVTSGNYSFSTLDPNQKNVSFTVFCDIHDRAGKLAKYLDSNEVEKQDCYFLNGDIMGHIEEEAQIYSSFLDTCVSRFASETPFYYVRGNHETRGKFARNLRNYIELPEDEYYYAQTIGNTRFIVLDGGEDKPDTTSVYAGFADFDNFRLKQLEWLKREIDGKEFQDADYKIVIIHMPVLKDKKNWYGMEFLATHYGPVLEKAGIDLMISGHMHRNKWINSNKSGFSYPIMICSNNNYVEAETKSEGITVRLKDLDGKIVENYRVSR